VGAKTPFALNFETSAPEKLDPGDHEPGASKYDVERSECLHFTRRQPGQLLNHELKVALDRGGIGEYSRSDLDDLPGVALSSLGMVIRSPEM
jgi:hypothetical protein